MERHLGDGRRFEHAGDIDLHMHLVVNAGKNLRGQKRIPAQREKIIVDTDPFARKDIGPDSGQLVFKRRARSNKRLKCDNAVLEPQLRRQPHTLHFAGGPFRQFFDDEHLARNLNSASRPRTN